MTKTTKSKVMLHEENIWPDLKTDNEKNNNQWYLDIGASNHMTGEKRMFAELDESISGTVKFGDNSVIEICG